MQNVVGLDTLTCYSLYSSCLSLAAVPAAAGAGFWRVVDGIGPATWLAAAPSVLGVGAGVWVSLSRTTFTILLACSYIAGVGLIVSRSAVNALLVCWYITVNENRAFQSCDYSLRLLKAVLS